MFPNVAGMTTPGLDPEAVRVGATIRALRDAHGLKGVELARAAKISAAYLSNIEAGRRPAPMAICRRIAKTFGVPLAAITVADFERIAESA
jgi:transcriptional regulator with XRE-family HTH domain